MITHLSIQGLAIIDSLSIDFSDGFNVITGETGAGKSILIRALNFLLGAKASAESVRKGFEIATVTGDFVVPSHHEAVLVLQNLGIPAEDAAGQCAIYIRRQITMKGRAQAWVNDVSVTSQALRELGATLVDVFGQHENQRLMNAAEHIRYLDDFVPEKDKKSRVQRLYREAQSTVQQICEMLGALETKDRDKDYLQYRLDELQSFEPNQADFERISELTNRAGSFLAERETLSQALAHLETASGDSLGQSLREAAKSLAQRSSLEPLKEQALEIANQIDDLSFELGKRLSAFEVDEGECEEASARLYGYQDLFRKHAVRDIESLLKEWARLSAERNFLDSAEAQIEESLVTLKRQAVELRLAADLLSEARRNAAQMVRKRVETELKELAMAGASFGFDWQPVERALADCDVEKFGERFVELWNSAKDILSSVGENGAERVEFLLASNPGEPILPLVRVASGGELSRIMLALKKALAIDAETCVLVFDEIDTGISGRVADVVGKKMRELSDAFQIICVSHLPQVAVYADTHFLAAKGAVGKRTESTIGRLSLEESAKEIARLLSGAEVSTTSLANAKHLIQIAHSKAKKGRKQASQPSA